MTLPFSGLPYIGRAYVVEVAALLATPPALLTIDNARGLARLLGVSYGRTLAFALHRMPVSSRYREFSVEKRSGGERVIHAPGALILNLQRRLLPLLEEIYEPPPCVHGYVKGRSIKTNATAHVGKRFVANLDLQDFFPSIHFRRIEGVLRSSRYGLHPDVARTIAQLCCHEGRLPIGAPTSGIISNIVLGPLDAELLRLAKATHLHYTRYADDLTFSSFNPNSLREGLGVTLDGSFIVRDITALSDAFLDIFARNGFSVNPRKIWVTSRQARQQVTGLTVNRKVNVKQTYYRNLRAAVRAAEKYGLAAAENRYQTAYAKHGAASLDRHILGKLSFLGDVCDYDMRYFKLARRVQALYPDAVIKNPLLERERSIYYLRSMPDNYEGTAFHIGNGIFLTAVHVFGNAASAIAARLSCPHHFGGEFVASVIFADDTLDIAVLRAGSAVADASRPQVRLADRWIRPGDLVQAFGFPQYAHGNTCSDIMTRVTARRQINGLARWEVDRALSHGMSGGPVFDDNGVFVGIVHSGPALGSLDAPFSVSFTPYTAFSSWLSERWSSP